MYISKVCNLFNAGMIAESMIPLNHIDKVGIRFNIKSSSPMNTLMQGLLGAIPGSFNPFNSNLMLFYIGSIHLGNAIVIFCLSTSSLPKLTVLTFSLRKRNCIAKILFHFLRIGQRRTNRTMNGGSQLYWILILLEAFEG